jgi:hypothetical protein
MQKAEGYAFEYWHNTTYQRERFRGERPYLGIAFTSLPNQKDVDIKGKINQLSCESTVSQSIMKSPVICHW